MKVIVNADDYGLDENRTQAIQEAFRLGAITSTTAMANMPWFERAMKEADGLGFKRDIGLHINLTEGEPLTDEMRNCRELTDERGRFDNRFHLSLKGRFVLSASARRAIGNEARAQMQRYLDCGGSLMQLDSHHHVHTDASVTPILYRVAKEFGFKSARLSRNIGSGIGLVKRCYKTLWNAYSQSILPSCVDYFGSFGDFKNTWMTLPFDSRVEVMVHPLYLRNGVLDCGGELFDTEVLLSREIDFWHDAMKKDVDLVRYDGLGCDSRR